MFYSRVGVPVVTCCTHHGRDHRAVLQHSGLLVLQVKL